MVLEEELDVAVAVEAAGVVREQVDSTPLLAVP